RLHVMAYETDDAERIARRMQTTIAAAGPERLSLALRVSDFADEWALEQAIDVLAGRLGIASFSLHDVADYITLTGAPL
ncbi:MAG: hypothetical protein ACU85V_15660, partial [Gammaproteobacteria bacterium]